MFVGSLYVKVSLGYILFFILSSFLRDVFYFIPYISLYHIRHKKTAVYNKIYPSFFAVNLLHYKKCQSVMKNYRYRKDDHTMGKIFKFGQDVDTDQIIASQYIIYPTIDEMKVHTFESLDTEFASQVQPGDYVVASENFGCGSSREQAPTVLKALGVKAVVAKSFARIFYRNAINIGLPVIVCKELYDNVNAGDEMVLSMQEGVVCVNGKEYECTKLPAYMQGILDQGGLIASLDRE